MDLSLHYEEIKKERERILNEWRKKGRKELSEPDYNLATDLAIKNLKLNEG